MCNTRSVATLVALVALVGVVQPGTHAQVPLDLSRFVQVGDMLIDKASLRPQDGRGRMAAVLDGAAWPGGVLAVAFASTIPADRRALFFESCNRWARGANVRCVLRSTEAGYVSVVEGRGCSATVGYGADPRPMILGEPGCWNEPTLAHEIGHAFGLLHEHQRADRDSFVTVQPAQILPGFESAFAIVTGTQPVGAYDFLSIMHYAPFTFNRADQPTLVAKPGYKLFEGVMGQGQPDQPFQVYFGGRSRPSAGDRAGLRARYGPPITWPLEPVNLRMAGASGNGVTVAWDPPQGGPPVRSYLLKAYATRPAEIQFIPSQVASLTIPAGQTSVTGSVPPGSYFIEVVSVGDAGQSEPSTALALTAPGGAPFVPPAPLTATASMSGNVVALSWTDAGSTPPAGYVLKVWAGDSAPFYVDVGSNRSVSAPLPEGVPFRAFVQARTPSQWSSSREVRFQFGGLAAPVLAAPIVSGRTVTISWSASAGASSYAVRARVPGRDAITAELPSGATSVSVPDVPPGSYGVSVVARGGGFQSGESNAWQIFVPQ